LQWKQPTPHDPRNLACQNHRRRQCLPLSLIWRCYSLWDNFIRPNSQPSLLCGSTKAVIWSCA
jgi:hypothetical protein